MPRYIARFEDAGKDYYLIWSTIVDAPVTFGVSPEEFKEYYRDEYGKAGLAELAERLERVAACGVSWHKDGDVDSLISCNRAGLGETCLTKEQIVDHYVRGNPLQRGTKDEEDGNE